MENKTTIIPTSELNEQIQKASFLMEDGLRIEKSGYPDRALGLYRQAERILRSAEGKETETETDRLQELSMALTHMARMMYRIGDELEDEAGKESAQNLFEEVIKIRQQLQLLDDGRETRRMLAVGYKNLARFHTLNGENKEAVEQYENSIQILNRLLDEEPDFVEAEDNLLHALTQTIQICEEENWTDDEIRFLQQKAGCLENRKEVLKNKEEKSDELHAIDFELNQTLARLIHFCSLLGDGQRAMEAADRQVALLQEYADVSNPYPFHNLSRAFLARGELDLEAGLTKKAEADLKQARELASKTGLPNSAFIEACALYHLASLAEENESVPVLKEYLEEALEVALASENPEERLLALADDICSSLGRLCFGLGDFLSAEKYFKEDVEIARKRAEANPCPETITGLHESQYNLNHFYSLMKEADPLSLH